MAASVCKASREIWKLGLLLELTSELAMSGPSNDAELSFLQPWREALRANVLPVQAAPDVSVRATMSCNTASLNVQVLSVRVAFPADHEARQDRQRLQRLREAVELLNFLSIVDNAAFKRAMASVLPERDDDIPFPGDEVAADVPYWSCELLGTLSAQDPVANVNAATWGQVLGCPDDPWEHSSDFRAAMQRLAARGQADRVHLRADLSWKAGDDDVAASESHQGHCTMSNYTSVARTMGFLFDAHVASVVQLCVVSNTAGLLETWHKQVETGVDEQRERGSKRRRLLPSVASLSSLELENPPPGFRGRVQTVNHQLLRYCNPNHELAHTAQWMATEVLLEATSVLSERSSLERAADLDEDAELSLKQDNLYLTLHPSAPELPALAVALAQRDVEYFFLGFNDRLRIGRGLRVDTEALGFLFGTLLTGHAACKLPRIGGLRLPFVHRSIKYLSLSCVSLRMSVYSSFCSAIAGSSSIKELVISNYQTTFAFTQTTATQWIWLAYSLFSRAADSSVRSLRLEDFHVDRDHVAAVAAVLQVNYPLLDSPSFTAQYGFVELKEGTELHPVGQNADVVLIVDSKMRCRALYDPESMDSSANVVIPGYGICRVSLTDRDTQFIPGNEFDLEQPSDPAITGGQIDAAGWDALDTADGLPQSSPRGRIDSLTLHGLTLENSESAMLMELLTLIGGQLRELNMGIREGHVVIDLHALAKACPKLRKLKLHGFSVFVSDHDALKQWPLRSVTIEYTNRVTGLASCLEDKALRELVKIDVSCRLDSRMRPEEIVALRGHDKECLPVVKEKFPLSGKMAMLSVASRVNDRHASSKAASRLDSDVLSLIFKMAATPEQRSVQVSTG